MCGSGDDPSVPTGSQMRVSRVGAYQLIAPGAHLGVTMAAPTDPALRDDVREALRNLRVPLLLAQSPLASGSGVAERAASVRELIARGMEHAFGDTSHERLLEQVLIRGYLDPAPSHEHAAAELHLSRSSYFRRLKAASDRVASCLALGPL